MWSAQRESCRQARSNPGAFSSSTRGPETGLEEINGDLREADFWTISLRMSRGDIRRVFDAKVNSNRTHLTTLKSVLLCGPGAGLVLVNHSTLHHENDTAHGGDVLQWITIKRNDVGIQSRREHADLVRHFHRLGGK